MKEQKPKYLRHFLKKLLPCLMTAVLVGISCTAGLYGIRYQSVTNTTYELFDRICMLFYNVDITEEKEEFLNERLAKAASNTEDKDWVDRAFLLECADTGKVYSSAPMFWAICKKKLYKYNEPKISEYYSHSEALLELYDRLAAVRRKHIFTKDEFRIKVQDIYVRDEGEEFLPGNVDLIRISYKDNTEKILESYNLTPADTSGYTHFTRSSGQVICARIGSVLNSKALELLQTQGENAHDRGWIFALPGEPLEVMSVREYLPVDNEGNRIPCNLSCAVYYHFWAEMKGPLLIGYSILFLLACITAAILAGFSCTHARKVWEMAEYRRNLTNTLAHDLKSPLTAIMGYAENMQSGMHKEKQGYYIGAVLQSAQYMNKMIADVLELADLEKTTSVRKEQTDVMELFRETFLQYEPELAERYITLYMDGSCMVMADRRMMVQAVANLVSNAVRYTPDGETITVSVNREKLTIANDCEEIPDAAKLAEPFAKNDAARNDHSGSGLGLTIVRQIMELHGFGFTLHVTDGQFVAELVFKA